MSALHDALCARHLRRHPREYDVVHVWPLGALQTIRAARGMRLPVVLERCNAHTELAYSVVQAECRRIGVELPKGGEHVYDQRVLDRELLEYREATGLLCPSEFVKQSYLDRGFGPHQLLRTIYGVDRSIYHPSQGERPADRPFTAIFVGMCAVRKGLHLGLEAWLRSPASNDGRFLIAGDFVDSYRRKLAPMLEHPSVQVLGHRKDVPELLRNADVLVFPSLEEGFGLVCTEAMASGVVPLVSKACTDECEHSANSFVHDVGDVAALADHLGALNGNRELLSKMRQACIAKAPRLTWGAAAESLLRAYHAAVELETAAPAVSAPSVGRGEGQ